MWSGGGGSLCSKETTKKKKERKKAPYESSVFPLSTARNTEIVTRASKYATFWNDISLCSAECVGVRCRCGSCRGWLRGASVSGPLRPGCPGRQRGRKPDSAAKPQSNVCLSSYLFLCLSVWPTAGHRPSACRTTPLAPRQQCNRLQPELIRSKKFSFFFFMTTNFSGKK